jgi:hypothetical protein
MFLLRGYFLVLACGLINELLNSKDRTSQLRNTRASGQLTLRRGRYSETVAIVEVGPLEVRRDTRKTIPLPPLIDGVALAGIVLVLVGARRGSDSMNRTFQSTMPSVKGYFCILM